MRLTKGKFLLGFLTLTVFTAVFFWLHYIPNKMEFAEQLLTRNGIDISNLKITDLKVRYLGFNKYYDVYGIKKNKGLLFLKECNSGLCWESRNYTFNKRLKRCDYFKYEELDKIIESNIRIPFESKITKQMAWETANAYTKKYKKRDLHIDLGWYDYIEFAEERKHSLVWVIYQGKLKKHFYDEPLIVIDANENTILYSKSKAVKDNFDRKPLHAKLGEKIKVHYFDVVNVENFGEIYASWCNEKKFYISPHFVLVCNKGDKIGYGTLVLQDLFAYCGSHDFPDKCLFDMVSEKVKTDINACWRNNCWESGHECPTYDYAPDDNCPPLNDRQLAKDYCNAIKDQNLNDQCLSKIAELFRDFRKQAQIVNQQSE